MAELASLVVATEKAPPNWLHSADIVLAEADTPAAAAWLAVDLLRRYPGCLAACVTSPDGEWLLLNWRLR
ncbi:MAG TPA: hypothetical protein VHX38_23205 [Pseudonocardiaceae bacterium]|jgi:hypothetical protein|nr:hypothetical protein [Pseudonocardiaceae bacterium]